MDFSYIGLATLMLFTADFKLGGNGILHAALSCRRFIILFF